MESLNKHCENPFVAKDKAKWYIQFWYKDSFGARKPYKKAYDLNKSDYIKKVNGGDVEINKTERKTHAQSLLTSLKTKLSKEYFNPDTRLFESLDKSDLPFQNYLADFINYNPKKKRSESTKQIYLSYNNVMKDWLTIRGLENIQLNEVGQDLIVEFLNEIEGQGTTTTQRDNYLTYLKGCFKYCTEYLEVLDKNPLRKLNTINNTDSESNKAYPAELLETVLEEAKKMDYHFYMLMRLLYYTLRRPSELLKLTYKDFDFKNDTINFHGRITKTNRTLYTHLPKHIAKELKSLIPSDVKPTDFFFGNIGKIGKKGEHSKLLFAKHETPLSHFQDKFKTLFSRLGLDKGHTLYSMKHSGIVYCIEVMQWSDYDIIAYTGHKSTAILGRYSRDAKRPVREHTGVI
ncbi:site-specific integrase [Pedobacter frigiditerrae]|uniref:tyrosine-type recombinase/integrase n=1 Tax=Pedobacter frigiditerrae TaxID=2530452 RepID=UPI00292F42ED|nr:site-specific integrase [Pedobacter frigiditerrae]